MFEGGEYTGGAMPSALGSSGGQPVSWGYVQWFQFAVIIVSFILIIIMFNWDEDMKKFREEHAFWKSKNSFGNREGLQYLGASLNVVPDHTGSERKDSLAEQFRKASEMESLIESGRDPNLYFTPVRQPTQPVSVTTAPSATGVAAGFRDRMEDKEEKLAAYLGK